MFSHSLKRKVIPGVIGVVHPFGKSLIFNPHVHCIVTEGGYDNQGKFISLGKYISYDAFHKKWQYEVLNALKKYLPKEFIDFLFDKYPKGFAAYLKPERIISSKRLAQYIGRYVRHPAIANSRIIAYNEEAVKFYWKDYESKINYKIMLANDFISSIIQHIPEKNFRLVRYYGAYSRRKKKIIKQSIIRQKILTDFNSKRNICCSKCGGRMEIVLFCDKPPPKDMSEINSWLKI
ncbi:MAG: transposase [Nanoarchaeota archaeon]|nr:transposase [Nanoarchaeota archaeon]